MWELDGGCLLEQQDCAVCVGGAEVGGAAWVGIDGCKVTLSVYCWQVWLEGGSCGLVLGQQPRQAQACRWLVLKGACSAGSGWQAMHAV